MRGIPFQHTAARRRLGKLVDLLETQEPVSTHSRPKAAGSEMSVLTNTFLFQHTAARRRLGTQVLSPLTAFAVSTHSRPKAAGRVGQICYGTQIVSTHSRPKAAGPVFIGSAWEYHGFNTQPPEGGW